MSANATDAKPNPENRLRESTSPYLLQHQHNPVNWRMWGEATLAEAQAGNKPILLSVGYAACHWCHVMAHESFEDEGIAALMNDLFVNIKVEDRKSTRLNSSHMSISYAVFCLKKKKKKKKNK